jgi:soluble lytic murein transglycosylase-like protein
MPTGTALTAVAARWRQPLAGLALLALHALAHADLWVYVDPQYVTHFAYTRLDERYELFYRDDPDAAVIPPAPAPASAAAAPDAGPRPSKPPVPPEVAWTRRFAHLKASPDYQGLQQRLQDAAATHHIEYPLLKAVVAVESSFNAKAVSSKGAVGLMQLMPSTARQYTAPACKDKDKDAQSQPPAAACAEPGNLIDPRVNIDAGARHLAYLIQLFNGQQELALAAYNAGINAVQRAGNKVPDYRQTQAYVKDVMGLYDLFKPPPLPKMSIAALRIKSSDRVRFEQPPASAPPAAPVVPSALPPAPAPELAPWLVKVRLAATAGGSPLALPRDD